MVILKANFHQYLVPFITTIHNLVMKLHSLNMDTECQIYRIFHFLLVPISPNYGTYTPATFTLKLYSTDDGRKSLWKSI